MTGRRRRGAAGITNRDVAKIEALSGETRSLMDAVTGMVKAADKFRAACMKAGPTATIAGAVAMRSAALPAMMTTAALLVLPACRDDDIKRLIRGFEAAQERLDAVQGDDDALDDLADLLSDIVAAGRREAE